MRESSGADMKALSHVPPGFRFHPTDEELVDYYLRKKIASKRIDLDVIKEVDLYKIEPWDLQEVCKIGSEEENEWYLFSHKDKKYPTGTRSNRATKAGFWKATGRDKAIYSKHQWLVGMRKTLVFYKGRAPNGHKSEWIMHEYRLETNHNAVPHEHGWVVCRVFKKRMAAVITKIGDYDPFMHMHHHHLHGPIINNNDALFLQLPQLQSPKLPPSQSPFGYYNNNNDDKFNNNINDDALLDQVITTDWRLLDKFVASQLTHAGSNTLLETSVSASTSASHVDLWK